MWTPLQCGLRQGSTSANAIAAARVAKVRNFEPQSPGRGSHNTATRDTLPS